MLEVTPSRKLNSASCGSHTIELVDLVAISDDRGVTELQPSEVAGSIEDVGDTRGNVECFDFVRQILQCLLDSLVGTDQCASERTEVSSVLGNTRQ